MKKLRPSDDSNKKAKINVVKVGGEDLYHVDEELSPVVEEVDEEDWGDEESELDLEEINGPEFLWRDGEHEPEGDPEDHEDASAGETRRKHKRNQLLDSVQCA